jgi:hypothetical protein
MLRRTLFVFLASLAVACSSSTTTTDGGADAAPSRPTCVDIIETCHEADMGAGPAHDCHENAHDVWTEPQCQANKAMCLVACALPDGGTDASSDATSDAHDDAAHGH